MVQLQNADRLNTAIQLGTVERNRRTLKNEFVRKTVTLGGLWSLSTSELIQEAGLNLTHTQIYLVHHRRSWDGFTRAQINGTLYEITGVAPDPFMNPTAYDRLTLRKVDSND